MSNPRTIYIVDDNADFRRSAQWWLASAGYEVVDYADPALALDALQAPPPQGQAVIQLIIKHQLPVSMSTKPDFSDYVDDKGVSRPRPR